MWGGILFRNRTPSLIGRHEKLEKEGKQGRMFNKFGIVHLPLLMMCVGMFSVYSD